MKIDINISRWSIIDALAKNSRIDPLEFQSYFYSQFVTGEESEEVNP